MVTRRAHSVTWGFWSRPLKLEYFNATFFVYRQKSKRWEGFILDIQTHFVLVSLQLRYQPWNLMMLVILSKRNCQFWMHFCVSASSSSADWHDETVSRLLETLFEKWEGFFKRLVLQDVVSVWNESTHYSRVIAVFKISLSLCIHLSCFWPDREGEAGGRRGGLISGDLQTLCSLVTFSQAETQEEAGYTLGFFFVFFFPFSSTLAFSLRFSCMYTQRRTHTQSQHSPFSLSQSETHTQNTHTQCMHTHTQALLGYRTAIAVRSPL